MEREECSKLEWLEYLGFVYKRLSRRWILVRLYSNKQRFGYHIIFPLHLKEEDLEKETFTFINHVSQEEIDALNARLEKI